MKKIKKPIDIIIPVYGDYKKTKNCIESVLKYSDDSQRLVLINDKSPEAEITEYLRKIKKKYPKITLIEHKKNGGFIYSVNEGMSLSQKNDVILLNSDTIVTKNWVQKMSSFALIKKNIATITPFSNSATIFSYPNFIQDNELVDDLNAEDINGLFEDASNEEIIEVPTGVGFCMYITRKSIEKIGLFDQKTFGLGYGEENDFCMRASKLGFRNIACTNTYIYHAHGASFGDTKAEKTEKAMQALLGKHPEYTEKVARFISEDPFKTLRAKVDYLRVARSGRPAVLYVQHNLGGGVEKHVMEMHKEAKGNGWNAPILEPLNSGVALYLDGKNGNSLTFQGTGWYENLLAILKDLNIQIVHFHHLLGLPESVINLAADLGVKKYFTVHDYYIACPRIFFLEEDFSYCGASVDSNECNECIQTDEGIDSWRRRGEAFLQTCDKVLIPSQTATNYILKYFPKLESIKIIQHVDYWWKNRRVVQPPNSMKTMKVAVIGTQVPHKGSLVFKECLEISQKEKLPIEWFVFGDYPDNTNKNVFIGGKYNGCDELRQLVSKYKIDVVLLPAIAPETYSFTLSESWDLGLPVISGDLGAIGERIKTTKAGWLVPYPPSGKEICELISDIIKDHSNYAEKLKSVKNYKPIVAYPWKEIYGDISVVNSKKGSIQADNLLIIQKITDNESMGIESQAKKLVYKIWGLLENKSFIWIKNLIRKTNFQKRIKQMIEGKKL